MRYRILLSLLLATLLSVPVFAQSERGSTEVTVNSKTVRIDYGRPSLNGRDVLSMAGVGTVWRLGADQATEIETTGDLMVAGKTLQTGRYSLWVKKTGDEDWILAFHPTTGVWGAPALKDGYVATLPLSVESSSESTEKLTIQLAENKNEAEIKISWGSSTLKATFGIR